MKPKNTTLLEKFGFKDVDLTTPKHDEIMIELLNPPVLIDIIIEKCFKDSTVSCTRICENYNPYTPNVYTKNTSCGLYDDLEVKKQCPFFDKEWREKIKDCPLSVEFTEEYEKISKMSLNKILLQYNESIQPEYVVKTDREFVIGYIDIRAKFDPTFTPDRTKWKIIKPMLSNIPETVSDFYFEIKTGITSFGETLRQINTYKTFCPGQYILVTPKTPFKEAFESNGVYVYEIGLGKT
jgi:hypothetical protein